jgi:hypothetical protein
VKQLRLPRASNLLFFESLGSKPVFLLFCGSYLLANFSTWYVIRGVLYSTRCVLSIAVAAFATPCCYLAARTAIDL